MISFDLTSVDSSYAELGWVRFWLGFALVTELMILAPILCLCLIPNMVVVGTLPNSVSTSK